MNAIAELGLAVKITAVVPATENMPSGHAMKPGDIVTAMNGKTIEINNTDAEGRLILADALHYAIEDGAERIVNLATSVRLCDWNGSVMQMLRAELARLPLLMAGLPTA